MRRDERESTFQRQPQWLLSKLCDNDTTEIRVIQEIHHMYRYTVTLVLLSLAPVALVLVAYALFSSGFPSDLLCYPHTATYNADFLFHVTLTMGAVPPILSLLARSWWVSHFFASDKPILTSTKLLGYETHSFFIWTYPPLYNTAVIATSVIFFSLIVGLGRVVIHDTNTETCALQYRYGIYACIAGAFVATIVFLAVHLNYARKWYNNARLLHSQSMRCETQ